MGEYGTEPASALVSRARAGDQAAYASLYERYLPMVLRTAHVVVRDAHEAHDVAQEAFYLVFRAIKAGRGPDGSFAGYILSTVRRLAFRHATARRRVWLTDDIAEHEMTSMTPPGTAALDDVIAAWESLPDRWREVLWLVEVDRYSPAELAPRLALSPSAVSSLATRARDALRTAFLAQQVLGEDPRCADVAPRLVALARGTLARRRQVPLRRHLTSCGTCRGRLRTLAAGADVPSPERPGEGTSVSGASGR